MLSLYKIEHAVRLNGVNRKAIIHHLGRVVVMLKFKQFGLDQC